MSTRTLTLPGDLSSLDPIADLVIDFSQQAGLDRHAAYQLRLAVDEIATNIVIHGYQEHGLTGDIIVSAGLDDRALVVELVDASPKYDPRARDIDRVEADFSKPLEERQIGGLGIYFAMNAVDEFRYEWRSDRNHNTFIVLRTKVENATAAANSAENKT
jgi:anti-sigma regulatory factor (Ser/Thr protein kinase)